MKLLRSCLVLIMAATLACGTAYAQKGGMSQKRGGAKNKENIGEMMQLMMMQKLKTELGLSMEETLKLMDIEETKKAKLKELKKQGEKATKALHVLVKDEDSSDDDIQSKLDEMVGVEEEYRAVEKESREAISDLLTPRQQAQAFLLKRKMTKSISQKMQGFRGEKHQGAPGKEGMMGGGRRSDMPPRQDGMEPGRRGQRDWQGLQDKWQQRRGGPSPAPGAPSAE
ncbi:hypothetical protein ACFL1X_10790 [Candidatus Hydrogenedentota bacterium]